MTRRAVLFDLDGTLADTLDDIADATNHALTAHGLPTHRREAYRELVGEGVTRLVERALPPGRKAFRQRVLDDLASYYVEHMLDRSAPYPGIPDLLDELAARGVPMAVLSNKPHSAARWMVERLFGAVPFVAVMGERSDVPPKPDPESALEIAADAGIEPSGWLYLGDTRTDMETATAAGMIPVGALWGFRDRDELEAHGARVVLESPHELLDLLTENGR